MFDLSSQVVLITGGSRGIGAATVRQAAEAGAAVGFTFLQDGDAAAALCTELRARGARVHALQGDVGDATFAARCFDDMQEQLGAVTALVNNAGITGLHGPFVDLPLEVMQRTLQVNVLGTMLFAQEAARRWRAAGIAGGMVNISSAAATLGSPKEYVHYAASKAAIEAFTIGLGKELAGEGIRVNAVAPGTAMTGIHAAGGAPDRPAQVVGRVPLQRIAEPGEIANAVLWLLSDDASYVAATVLRVAGGL